MLLLLIEKSIAAALAIRQEAGQPHTSCGITVSILSHYIDETDMPHNVSTRAVKHGHTLARWLIVLTALLMGGCDAKPVQQQLEVTATAYTSHRAQTNDTPNLAAWGDQLTPGMKAIAVSRDLLQEGLSYGTYVKIEGLPGQYQVLDKMHKRWRRKIDIYMGKDRQKALDWGNQQVTISWQTQAAN